MLGGVLPQSSRGLDFREPFPRQNFTHSALVDVKLGRYLMLGQIGACVRHQLYPGGHGRRQPWATSFEHSSHPLSGLGQKIRIDHIVNTMFTISHQDMDCQPDGGAPMLAERLRLARKRAGMSLRDLAAKIDHRASAQAISKYENGAMLPSASVLVVLGKALSVSLDFLMSSQVIELAGVEFRKKSGTSVGDRAKVEAEVIDQVERYLTIEAILEIESADHALKIGLGKKSTALIRRKIRQTVCVLTGLWDRTQSPASPPFLRSAASKSYKPIYHTALPG